MLVCLTLRTTTIPRFSHTISRVSRVAACGLLLLLLLFWGARQTHRAEQLPARTYTVADGLAHDQVQTILRDSHGFLWFCTIDGLTRFDGRGFTTYSVREGLPVAHVNDIIEARDGAYWVATNDGGVSRFTPLTSSRLYADSRAMTSFGTSWLITKTDC